MTPIGLMDKLAKLLQDVLKDYSSTHTSGKMPVSVYPGWPPVRDSSKEQGSYVYVLVLETKDNEDANELSTAKVEIGFNIYDDDKTDGWRSLFNIMEHVRQALLAKRFIEMNHRIVLPMVSAIADTPPFPQWLGKIEVNYTIGQPIEEGINYDDFQETRTTYGDYEK